MNFVYKVTSDRMKTHDTYTWLVGKRRAIGMPMLKQKPNLCTNRVLHAFDHPLQLLIFNNEHNLRGMYRHPRLFSAKGNVVIERHDKVGLRTLTLVKELTWPRITRKQLSQLVSWVIHEYGNVDLQGQDCEVKGGMDKLFAILDGFLAEHYKNKDIRARVYGEYERICGLPKEKV